MRDVGLRTASDPEIFEFAVSDDRVIVTADADFAMMLAARRAVRPSVVQLRSADHLTPDAQAALLISNLDRMADALTAGAVASLSGRHLRVRHLPTRT